MSGTVNKVILIGNLGKNPEIRVMGATGNRVCNLSIATSESWKDKATGERRAKTEWHRVAIFSQGLIDVAERYIQVGTKVYIEGVLQTQKWQDKEGNDRYTTQVVVQGFNGKMQLLDGNRAGTGPDYQAPLNDHHGAGNEANRGKNAGSDLDDEVPF